MTGVVTTYQPQSTAVNKNHTRKPTDHEIAIQKKVDRLKPMIAAMRAQTPDDPMKPADVIATVNQANFATTIEDMNVTIMEMNARSEETARVTNKAAAISMIGTQIDGFGSFIELKEEGDVLQAQIPFALPHDVQSLKVQLFDEGGLPIRELSGNTKEGQHILHWDGKSANGKEYPAGTYTYSVEAIDKNGNPMMIQSMSKGIVTGVEFNGKEDLLRIGGSMLPMRNVRGVGRANAAAAA